MTLLQHTIDGEGPHLGVMLHGILGSRGNWASFAKKLAERHADWRFCTVDLRNHGDSFHAGPDDDNSLKACADDLLELFMHLGQEPAWLSGHSFGGKVAMVYADECATELSQLWILDSTPGLSTSGRVSGEVERVLDTLRSIPMPVARRDDVVEAVVARGLSLPIAKWMTTNLRRDTRDGASGFQWRFHLDGVEAMLRSYAAYDGYKMLHAPPCAIGYVRGAKSDRWTADDIAHLHALHDEGHIALTTLDNAGHWVHTDAPEALLAVFDDNLKALAAQA